MTAQAVVFLRPDGAADLGHVGFGYELPGGPWVIGGLEGYNNEPIVQPPNTGFWWKEVPNGQAAEAGMMQPVTFGAPDGTPAYANAKVFQVASPNPDSALAALHSWVGRPYLAAGGNCMNCCYDVLTAFGASLIDPTPNPALWIPNDWFNNLNGTIAPA